MKKQNADADFSFHYTHGGIGFFFLSTKGKITIQSSLIYSKVGNKINACKEHLEELTCIAVHYCLNETDLY